MTRGAQGPRACSSSPTVRSGAPFTEEDLNLLLAVAGQASVAVENLRLHEEIKRANALLQEYDRLKSEFVAIVAHDFRKPLMAIRGFAELRPRGARHPHGRAAGVHAHGHLRDRATRPAWPTTRCSSRRIETGEFSATAGARSIWAPSSSSACPWAFRTTRS